MTRERITNAMLDQLCKQINEATGSPTHTWTKGADGRMTASLGHYHIDGAYGGVALQRMCSEGGGVTTVIPRGTKRELYDRMRAYMDGIKAGRTGESPSRTFG